MFNPLRATFDAYQEKFGPLKQSKGDAYTTFSTWIKGSEKISLRFAITANKGTAHANKWEAYVGRKGTSKSLQQAKVRLYAGLVAITALALALLAIAVTAISAVAFTASIAFAASSCIALIAAAVGLIAHVKFKNSIRGLVTQVFSLSSLLPSSANPVVSALPSMATAGKVMAGVAGLMMLWGK